MRLEPYVRVLVDVERKLVLDSARGINGRIAWNRIQAPRFVSRLRTHGAVAGGALHCLAPMWKVGSYSRGGCRLGQRLALEGSTVPLSRLFGAVAGRAISLYQLRRLVDTADPRRAACFIRQLVRRTQRVKVSLKTGTFFELRHFFHF